MKDYKLNKEEPAKVKALKSALETNKKLFGKPYCPCSIERTEEKVCPCKEFRENKKIKKCVCGLYIRE